MTVQVGRGGEGRALPGGAPLVVFVGCGAVLGLVLSEAVYGVVACGGHACPHVHHHFVHLVAHGRHPLNAHRWDYCTCADFQIDCVIGWAMHAIKQN